jgi:DNA polymerase-4
VGAKINFTKHAVSAQIMAMFKSVTSLMQPLSLDEAFLDLTSVVRDFPEALHLASAIKQRIRGETGLTASAGLLFNKFLAKLASDAHKPDGLTLITPEQAPAFLDALPIERFFGVGKVTAAQLRKQGIQSGADLRQVSEERLRALLGSRGSLLYRYVRAEDERPVEPIRERKSVGKETTLERDITDRDHMEAILANLAEQVEGRLTDLGLAARTLSLKVRWSDFQLITRSVSRGQGFRYAAEMLPVLHTLLFQLGNQKRAVRLLGVFVSNLQTVRNGQIENVTPPSLWDEC